MVRDGGGPFPEARDSTAASDAPGPWLSPLFEPLHGPGTPVQVSENSCCPGRGSASGPEAISTHLVEPRAPGPDELPETLRREPRGAGRDEVSETCRRETSRRAWGGRLGRWPGSPRESPPWPCGGTGASPPGSRSCPGGG